MPRKRWVCPSRRWIRPEGEERLKMWRDGCAHWGLAYGYLCRLWVGFDRLCWHGFRQNQTHLGNNDVSHAHEKHASVTSRSLVVRRCSVHSGRRVKSGWNVAGPPLIGQPVSHMILNTDYFFYPKMSSGYKYLETPSVTSGGERKSPGREGNRRFTARCPVLMCLLCVLGRDSVQLDRQQCPRLLA